jgi:membrane protease YdiL (CAAX protease family)
MKKLILLLITVLIIIDVSYASFPVNNINNQIYNQSEIVSESSPIPAILILSYLISIFWYLSKPIPKDVKKRKKFFRKLLLLIFIPVIIVGILVIYSLQHGSYNISLDDFE